MVIDKTQLDKTGCLYIVATPIGNMDDISNRAIATLKQVDMILAEDTRHSAQLLKYFGIEKNLRSFHEHNENRRLSEVIDLLLKGQQLALISDAGTPLISDPGYRLVHTAREENIKVVPIPGACALISALSVSGLETDKFCFEGFLPKKQTARIHQLKNYLNESRTLIFYEAPHRLLVTIEDMMAVFGAEHKMTLARELTKHFETIISGSLYDVAQQLTSDHNQQKGEMVLVVSGFKQRIRVNEISEPCEQILSILLKELSLKQSVSLTVKMTGEKKKLIYQRALQLQQL